MELLQNKKSLATILLIVVMVLVGSVLLKNDQTISEGRVHVHKPVFFPDNTPSLNHHTLVFFGYVGCQHICLPRMEEIKGIYKEFVKRSNSDKLSVLFINLKEGITTEEADSFAKSFDPSFHGVSFERKVLERVMRMFHAYYAHTLRPDEEIDHTQFLYFLHKDNTSNFYLNTIYVTVPYERDKIVDDLIKDLEP